VRAGDRLCGCRHRRILELSKTANRPLAPQKGRIIQVLHHTGTDVGPWAAHWLLSVRPAGLMQNVRLCRRFMRTNDGGGGPCSRHSRSDGLDP